MIGKCSWTALVVVWSIVAYGLPALAADKTPSAEQVRFFETQVRPLLAEHCYKCHGADRQRGGLRLDSLGAMLQGGESGLSAVEPGKPDDSLLIEAIRYESYEMPPTGQLKDAEIAVLTEWVKQGAHWPGADAYPHEPRHPKEKITDEDRAFWSFQPVREPQVPQGDDGGWSRNEIDRFLFAKLHGEGLEPAAEADRATLIRRAYFDLIGLPPTPEEIDAFVSDPAPDAWEKLIDRLLDSEQYGERWARHWLDLIRYAESDGWRQDAYRPHAWRYRDYVIRSLNQDKPYDRFVIEQLAGDEIAPDDPDALTATGFLRHGIYEYNQRDSRTQWSEIINDITDVTADVFLGMGLGCARCHDHKFDPILQKDYYTLQAFFGAILPRDDVPLATPQQIAEYEKQLAVWEEKTADIRAEIDKIEAPHRRRAAEKAIEKFPADVQEMIRKSPAARTSYEHQVAELAYRQVYVEYDRLNIGGKEGERLKELREQLAEFDNDKPEPLPEGMTVSDVEQSVSPTIIPGDRRQEELQPAFLTVLTGGEPVEIEPMTTAAYSTGRRTALARWITDPQNPLTTRVAVNRIWQYHFGRGLVATPSDFGRLGEPPSHPELLDWLAVEFVRRGWSFKEMHRLMMNSAAYRQSALRPAPEVARLKDPENRWLWRMPIRRLDAEQIRDALLSVTGELDLKTGGPSVNTSSPRRSIYTKVIRNTRDPLLDVFDTPDGYASTPERNVTTTPTQALMMINGEWMLQRAKAFARKLPSQAADGELVTEAWRRTFGRMPTSAERDEAIAFLREQTERIADRSKQAGPLAEAMPHRSGQAAVLKPGSRQERLVVPESPSLPDGEFTIEAVVLLRSFYPDSTVRTIVSQWTGDSNSPGWSLGLTSEKSKYKPGNLIVQLVGDPRPGGDKYQVIASNLFLKTDRPYYVAATVRLAADGPGEVTFTVKDLSDDSPLQTAAVEHPIQGNYRSNVALTIGGRDRNPKHVWDGLIDEVRLSRGLLTPDKLLLHTDRPNETTVGWWRFEAEPGFYNDSSGRKNDIVKHANIPGGARTAALIDFCHVLLNSNEFLYVE